MNFTKGHNNLTKLNEKTILKGSWPKKGGMNWDFFNF